MKIFSFMSNRLFILAAVVLFGASVTTANAESPCPSWGSHNEFGECKVLVEMNASDGDVGFHFLVDGDNLIRTSLYNPHWRKIWSYYVKKELRDQTLTESFNESAEPLCFDPLLDNDAEDEETYENDEEDFRTLTEFVDLWKNGRYYFVGVDNEWDWAVGKTHLTFNLPAAPEEIEFELEEDCDADGCDIEGEISWQMGEGLGMCDEFEVAPDAVTIVTETGTGEEDDERIVAWEIVLEPEFDEEEDINAQKGLVYSIRVGAGADGLECEMDDGDCIYEMEIPDDYLESLPDNTLVKAEIGAITSTDNATFTEEGEWCVNDEYYPDGMMEDGVLVNGCGEEIEVDD